MKNITNGQCKVLARVTRKLNKVAGGDIPDGHANHTFEKSSGYLGSVGNLPTQFLETCFLMRRSTDHFAYSHC
jgi:hypothetical protein